MTVDTDRLMPKFVRPGDWLEGPFWNGPVNVVAVEKHSGYDVVSFVDSVNSVARPVILTADDWKQVQKISKADRCNLPFTGDPENFRLGVQALRLKLAHSIDPYAGLNASRIDPLPHQFEAVYEHLLARSIIRALLAHDAGAGKTIMAGIIIKELKRRQDINRILIVSPAALTIQWRRELLTKFGEDFTIISREMMDKQHLDILDVWRSTDLAITSVAFSRQKYVRRALEAVEWDLVIVDEAHKLAAYRKPNGSTVKTQAYELGEVLTRRAIHFLLMTATPHKGDPENYRLLIRLIDPEWGDALAHGPGHNPLVLRRTKEEMRKPNGDPLYPERVVETIPYNLSASEGELLEQVFKLVRRRFEKAKSLNRQNAAFALIMLSRRLASSPYALRKSLERMRSAAERRSNRRVSLVEEPSNEEHWEEWEDLPETERWKLERQAEEAAAEYLDLKQLDSLITRNDALISEGVQQKINELKKACDLWVKERGEQMIVFTEFKDTLDHLLDCMRDWEISTAQIHGGMALPERRQAEKLFWEGQAQVLVATEAAGEGINLQCCHVMINFDLPWNPTRLEQRMGRIHRYGQKADTVYIFNLLAQNSMEDEVKQALLDKLNQMRKDLGDKVFDVVGQVLWHESLRQVLEQVSLGISTAVEEAHRIIYSIDEPIRQALETERNTAFTSTPIDIAEFQRKQSTFRAYRLSPEASETFFRHAIPFIGGVIRENIIQNSERDYPIFEVSLPPEISGKHPQKLTVSFWAEACSDDDMDPNAVLFISPGHWLFDALIEQVLESCRPDLENGAVFFDLHPSNNRPYLVWFSLARLQDGLGRRAGELLSAMHHQADTEQVRLLPSEILEGFDACSIKIAQGAIQQVQPMLAAQETVIEQCVRTQFLPILENQREHLRAINEQDSKFLEAGLQGLAENLSASALEAFITGDEASAAVLTDQAASIRQRLGCLHDELDRAGRLLLQAPEIFGVALVLPAPDSDEKRLLAATSDDEHYPTALMRRDDRVEEAAMQIVIEDEIHQERHPKDVHTGRSWDIESCDAQGRVLRYIEVKGRGPKEAEEVSLTDPEWEAARRLGDQYWLYIVRLEDKRIWRIQNPYEKLRPKELRRWLIHIKQVEGFSEN